MATALITGASQGIGACIAKRLAKDGYNVAINHFPSDSDKANAEKVAEECRSFGVEAELFAANVADYAQCEAMTKAVKERFGSIDALVNNAGITKDAMFHKMTVDQWNAVIQVNLQGVFNCTHNVINGMRQQGYGRIVNMSSKSAYGEVGQANYAATKAALIGFTKTLAKESARKGITVNAIAPDFINTPMMNAIPADNMAARIKAAPMQRMGNVEEVAALVAFLVSDESSYVNGDCIDVNGATRT